MKKLILTLIIALMCVFASAQKNHNDLESINKAKSIEEQYIDWCYADSVYSGYMIMFYWRDSNNEKITYTTTLEDPAITGVVRVLTARKIDYKRKDVTIKKPHEKPTFEGFVRWRKRDHPLNISVEY